MENKEVQLMQKEIYRLQSMVDILIENNTQLKQLLAHYQKSASGTPTLPGVPAPIAGEAKTSFYSNDQLHNKAKINFSPYVQKMDGVKKSLRHIAEFINRVKTTSEPLAEFIVGVKTVSGHYVSFGDGIKTFREPYVSFGNGVNNNFTATGSNGNAANIESIYLEEKRSALITYDTAGHQPDSSIKIPQQVAAKNNNMLPNTVTNIPEIKEVPKEIDFYKVVDRITAMNPKSSESSRYNTAEILLCLLESPKQSLKDLQKLTDLSEDGIVKRIMAMKKRGWIVRAPGRRLLLTAKAQQILEEARE